MNKTISFLAIIALCVGCDSAYDQQTPEPEKPTAESDASGQLHWPKVTISKETTFFTEPLRPDGGVDYVAALNRRLSEGVTPENNALIPLLQATGPNDIDKKIRKRYFQMLGIPELPEKGDYLIGFWDLPEYKEAEKQSGDEFFSQRIWEQYDVAREAPWSKQDFPLWATALERDEKLLDMVVEGLQRPRFYSPLVLRRDDENLLAGRDLIAGITGARWVIRLLGPRAMLRLHDGDVSGAWGDILAMYRLGRLESVHPFIVNWMVGVTFDNMASHAAVVLSHHEGLSATQARECQRQLRNLPAMRHFGEICNEGERCSSLESLTLLSYPEAQGEYFEVEKLLDQMKKITDPQLKKNESDWKKRREAYLKLIAENDVDWTEVFRQYNSFFDRLANACSCPKSTKAVAMLETLESETKRQAKQAADIVLAEHSDAVKDMNANVKAHYIAKLSILQGPLHLWEQCVRIEQRRQAYEHMTLIAFALAGYRAEHNGEYPTTLAQLIPAYIDVISKDPFTDGDFRYRAENGGYLLYSVGQNGKDDGGVGPGNFPDSASEEQKQSWDDVSIRTPRK